MTEIQLSKKEILHRLNSMKIRPEGLAPRKFGVTVKYFKGNEDKPEKRIDYEATATVSIVNGIGQIEINKENIYYNQHEPDLINEKFADAISKSFYPFVTHYNERGITSGEILNHAEMLKRWDVQKEKILEKYASDDLNTFLEVVDNKFSNVSNLERNLSYDWFWNLFFHPKLINYGDTRTVDSDLALAVVPYRSPVIFSGKQTIEKIPTDYHSFTVKFVADERKAPSYFNQKNSDVELLMSLNVNFDLDLYHHFPMHTIAEFEVYSKDSANNKLISKRIRFTMYELNSDVYKNKVLSEKSPFITGGLVKVPKNKWGFDNFEDLENNW